MKLETKKALAQAINIIEGREIAYGYQRLSLFSSENINGMLRRNSWANKHVLLADASEDHVFNMLVAGVDDIDIYDTNPLKKFMFYFKAAAFRTLTREELIKFLFKPRFGFKQRFDEKTFEKILGNIQDEDAKELWTSLFKMYGGSLYSSNLFFRLSNPAKNYIACNSYLKDDKSYALLQKRLETFKYKCSNQDILKKTSTLPRKKYDYIYLSTRLERIKCKTKEQSAKRIKAILNRLKNHLNEDGVLGFYLFYFEDSSLNFADNGYGDITDILFRLTHLKDVIAEYIPFAGIVDLAVRNPDNRDAVAIVPKNPNRIVKSKSKE